MKRDASAPCQTSLNTGMAWSVLSEIRTLLNRLAETGETAAIDLKSRGGRRRSGLYTLNLCVHSLCVYRGPYA